MAAPAPAPSAPVLSTPIMHSPGTFTHNSPETDTDTTDAEMDPASHEHRDADNTADILLPSGAPSQKLFKDSRFDGLFAKQ